MLALQIHGICCGEGAEGEQDTAAAGGRLERRDITLTRSNSFTSVDSDTAAARREHRADGAASSRAVVAAQPEFRARRSAHCEIAPPIMLSIATYAGYLCTQARPRDEA